MIYKNSYIKTAIVVLISLFIMECHMAVPRIHSPAQTQGSRGFPTPHSCLVTGIVVHIEKQEINPDTSSLCAQAPCLAQVCILEVENCGQSIIFPLHYQDTIQAYFTCSLASNRKLTTEMKISVPGLQTGDHFQAYVEQRIQPGDQVIYRIDTYLKLNY